MGFEPTVAHRATTVFETAPFTRSGTSPRKIIRPRTIGVGKVPGPVRVGPGGASRPPPCLEVGFFAEGGVANGGEIAPAHLLGEGLCRAGLAVDKEDAVQPGSRASILEQVPLVGVG